jgi:hypothetical protein
MVNNDFEEFSEQCLEDFMPRQDAFIDFYEINSYESWYYDNGLGIFEFKSNDGRKLYFRYVDVGSFSTKTNTWNWSWANSATPLLVKRRLNSVRLYGEENGFPELTMALIDGDEYTGWAMTAITAELLSAIGGYRIPHDHLFIYFVFTSQLTDDEYNEQKDNYIQCDRHGGGKIAFVCCHLINNTGVGFNEAFDSDGTAEPGDGYQAWCAACEEVRLANGGWNETAIAFTDVKLVCNECYFEIKQKNKIG